MKIVFLFDQTDADGKVVSTESVPFVITPDKLNLRQLQPGVSSLGVIFEQADEKGETQQYFRQIINFPINLVKVFPTLDEEIAYLKALFAQKVGQQAVEAEAAKLQASAAPAAAQVTPAPAPVAVTPGPTAPKAEAPSVTNIVNVSKPVVKRAAKKTAVTAPAVTK